MRFRSGTNEPERFRWWGQLSWFLVLLCPGVFAESLSPDDIEVEALFTNTVVMRIAGERRTLKIGESVAGILLLNADSRSAEIELDGERHVLRISDRVNASFKPPRNQSVTIAVNDSGQYLTSGSINGVPVRLLVDTGATTVAVNSTTARKLGIGSDAGEKRVATTAGGLVSSRVVMLESVQVGDIMRENVRALVVDGDYPRHVLLGMTFLEHVEITEKEGLMVLRMTY